MDMLGHAAARIIGSSALAPRTAAGPRRPETLRELTGQQQLVNEAELILAGAKRFGEALGHVLLVGPPGTGKTTIAKILAREVGGRLIDVGVGGLAQPADVRKYLAMLREGDILFVDEVHQVPKKVQEFLFIPMEDNRLVVETKSGRPVSVELPQRWTLIAATTMPHKLDPAFKRRFPNRFALKLLSAEDLVPIAKGMADSMGLTYDDDAIRMVAEMGGGTPGLTRNTLIKARNAMALLHKTRLDREVVLEMRRLTRLDRLGLSENHRGVLEAMDRKPEGERTSLHELSDMLGIDKGFIEDDLEPTLMRLGLMRRGAGGREITDRGREHLRRHRAESA